MYRLALLFAISLFVACSDPPSISVDCSLVQQDEYSLQCGSGNNGSTNVNGSPNTPVTPPAQPSPVILQAGCYQDIDKCPQTFPLSWLVEHCTVPYVCPVRDYDAGPDETVCLRFIETDCWDANSN